MKIDNCFPDPVQVIQCESRTLKFFKSNHFLNQEMPRLSEKAYKCYRSDNKHVLRRGFEFESEFDIKIGSNKGIALIGAFIKAKDKCQFENISYYAAICENGELHKRLLRKYHFDYAPPGKTRRQPHPIFHIQYAGKLSPKLQEMRIDDSHLDVWLSEPRLCYFPTSLALLINMVLKEFPNDKNIRLVESTEWRSLIRSNEDLILAPFFKGCNRFFSGREKKLFINDFYYGN